MLVAVGCNSEAPAGPPPVQKQMSDEEFEKSIANIPEEAKASARAGHAQAKAMSQQTGPKK